MTSLGSGYYSYVWAASGFLTVVVPLVFRSMKVKDFQKLNMMYNWDQQWEEQQQQQQEEQNNWNDQYEQMRQYYEANRCHWWNLSCEEQQGEGWYPSWYSGWVQTEEDRQELQEAGVSSGPMRFVYVWQILTFVVILAYGFLVLKQDRPVTGLTIALVVYANMCFMSMWWLADASIITDTELVQTTGFYGQLSVLMFITNAAYVLFGLVHTGLLVWWGYTMEEQVKHAGEEELYIHPTFENKKVAADEGGWTIIE